MVFRTTPPVNSCTYVLPGLEVLVAVDIVKTIAIELTFTSLGPSRKQDNPVEAAGFEKHG
jgi:hypothetical protein